MPSHPRRDVVIKGEVGVYHCWNRCVQEAWLFGTDPSTGKDFGHRREVIEQVEQQLAALFAVDIGFQAEQVNHLHLILRTRPDLASTYSDDEVLRRWWIIARIKRNAHSDISDPTKEQLAKERRRHSDLSTLRARLSSLSWFMGTLCEHLSRRFNGEGGKQGTFWEHRYGCQRLETEASILVCGIYVDLNPIRAGEVFVPEAARYTSAYHRIQARQQSASDALTSQRSRGPADWLCPLTLQEDDPSQLGAVPSALGTRASDKGLLSLSLEKYLELLDWTGRQIRSPEKGSIPAQLPPILERLGIRHEHWLESVSDFEQRFGHIVGPLKRLQEAAQQAGRRWFRGVHTCAATFG